MEGSKIQKAGLMVGDKILAFRTDLTKNHKLRWIKGCKVGKGYKLLRNGKTLTIESRHPILFRQYYTFEFSRLRHQED